MAPSCLVSTYGQYKQDLDTLATWLVSTAKKSKIGDPANISNPEQPYPAILDSEHLNGKTVRISDFEPLAEWISALDKSVPVPDWLGDTIDRMIDMRTTIVQDSFGITWDVNSSAPRFRNGNILRRVRVLLRTEARHTKTSPLQTVENAESVDEAAAPAGASPNQVTNLYEAELHTSAEDALAIYGMVIHDLNKIRDKVKAIWSQLVCSGAFDPAVAAVATNSAVDLAGQLINEIAPIFEQYPYRKLASVWYMMSAKSQGFATPHAVQDAYEVGDKTLWGTSILLQEFFSQDKYTGYYPQVPQSGEYGEYDPKADRSHMSGPQKTTEDRVLLMDILGELLTITCLMPDTFPPANKQEKIEREAKSQGFEETFFMPVKFPVADEFMRYQEEACKTSKVTLPLVFAAQIFLDLHHTMRRDVEKVYLFCLDEINRVVGTLTEHLRGHDQANTHPDWLFTVNIELIDFLETTKWIHPDPIRNVKRDIYFDQHGRHASPESMPPNILLRSSPVISGLLLFHFRLELHHVGLAVSNMWGAVPYTWHLYNACQQEGLLKGRFQDIELAYNLLRSENFHSGNKPTDIDGYFDKYCQHIGLTPSMFHAPYPRWVPKSTPVTDVFSERYRHNSGELDWTPENLDTIIAARGSQGSITLEGLGGQSVQVGQKTTAAALVEAVALALQGEVAAICFPLLVLHRVCCKLLGTLGNEMSDALRSEGPPWLFVNLVDRLPFWVGFILAAAKGQKENPVDMGPLKAAAKAIQRIIDRRVGKFIAGNQGSSWDVDVDIQGLVLDEKRILRTMREHFQGQTLRDFKAEYNMAGYDVDKKLAFELTDVRPRRRQAKSYMLTDAVARDYRHVLIMHDDDDF